jgi:RNA polymerase sigma factor (TIGR02999 family)
VKETSVTVLLEAHRRGEANALDRAFTLVYHELRRMARYHLKGQGRTLDTTSLVHEAYLKLAVNDGPSVENRAHFMALASRAMRQIIVDYARARAASKRGGAALRVTFDTDVARVEDEASWILSVDQALRKIRDIDERLEQVFECRYFAGLTEEESAVALGVSVSTIQRDWNRAKAWLRESLADQT